MENEIHAELTLSSTKLPAGLLDELVPKLAAESLARTLGRRGEGKLVEFKHKGDRLTIVLASQGARPHQSLLALVRQLTMELGKQAKVGLRGLSIPKYKLTFPIEAPPEKPVTLPIPHKLTFHEGSAVLELLDLPEEGIRDNWPDRTVTLVQEKIRRQTYAGKEQFWRLIEQGPARDHPFKEDPTEAMLARHWVRNGPTKGKWFLGPIPARLLRTMERIAKEEVLDPLGFAEVVQPHHDSFDTLIKSGHMQGLPGEFYYVTEPKSRDPADWQTFTDLVSITHKVPEEELQKRVSPPSAVSCYAQCPTVYWWLSGRTLPTDALPLKVFDRAAISNRYESGGRHGLERVDEFHRIEPVYLGTPEQLVALRDQLIERYRHVFDTILEIEWRTAWVTPFYLQQSGGVGIEDANEKVKGTIDFEAYLPYRGPRETAEWLEFQNLSIVGDKYTKAFTIRTQKGELWSGCTGIGLERWMTAFLAEKGLDPQNWPARFREYVGEMPREVRFL
jgi:seryl-tRNA synthetase